MGGTRARDQANEERDEIMAEKMQIVANLTVETVDVSKVDAAMRNSTKTLVTSITEGIMRATAAAGQISKKIPSSEQMVNYGMRDFKKDLLGASGIGKEVEKLKGSFGNIAQGGSAAASKLAGGGDAAGITTIIATLLGDTFNEIVNILQSIMKILLAMFGILMVVRVISDVISAIWNSFGNLEKIWSTVMTLISKMVSPFVNLLIPLLVPFLYLFSTLGRILNLMLMPLFTLMMKAFSALGQNGTITKASTQIMGGDILGGLGTLFEGMVSVFNTLKAQITTTLTPLFNALTGFIVSFLTLDLNSVHNVINNLLGSQLGSVINGFIDIVYKGISAIAGFIAQLVGKGSFDKMFGSGEFDKISKSNSGFQVGVDVASTLQQIWTALNEFLASLLKDPPATLYKTFKDTFDGFIEQANRLVLAATGIDVKKLWDDITAEWKKVSVSIGIAKDTMFGADDKSGVFGSVSDALGSLAKALKNWADLINGVNPAVMLANAISALMDWLKALNKPGGDGTPPHNDFIWRANGGATSFSPDDTIIGVKDPSALGGGSGGSTIINNYINGNGDKFLENTMVQIIEKYNSGTSRYGYFQKGY